MGPDGSDPVGTEPANARFRLLVLHPDSQAAQVRLVPSFSVIYIYIYIYIYMPLLIIYIKGLCKARSGVWFLIFYISEVLCLTTGAPSTGLPIIQWICAYIFFSLTHLTFKSPYIYIYIYIYMSLFYFICFIFFISQAI